MASWNALKGECPDAHVPITATPYLHLKLGASRGKALVRRL
jgi:hypothetical protein